MLTLPSAGLAPADLAVVVAQGDSVSEAIAAYYVNRRGIPAANVVRVVLPSAADAISAVDFAALKARLDAILPFHTQAMLLTFASPSRVVGSCAMGLTSALAFGYDPKYCVAAGAGCTPTTASPYFDSESSRPFTDFGIRPAMMLGSHNLADAKALVDRGVSSDGSVPAGDGYLVRTTDVDRSARYPDFVNLPALWATPGGLRLNYIDNAAGTGSDAIANKSNVLFYFTGLPAVANLTTNTFAPGAAADHLTSFGAYLPSGNGQMPVTAWIDAGATATYGAVEEPCNYPQKFSRAPVLIDQYYRGNTLLEAYWKSVQWPGQGLFVGEPLARPFSQTPSFAISNGQYIISTRALRPGATYQLDYRVGSGPWINLLTTAGQRARAATLTAPLAPASATQLRWTGPCPVDRAQVCTLASSL